MVRRLGLRGKSVLALFGTSALVLLVAGIAGWQVVDSMRGYMGASYASNLTLLNRERILAPVSRELAMSVRLAKSQVVRQWLLDENAPAKKAQALTEAEDFRADFTDKSYFLASLASGDYYFNSAESASSAAPRYRLKKGDPKDSWFYNTMNSDSRFNINVDLNRLGITKVWFNVMVMDQDRKLGLAGSGLDLTTFLKNFIDTNEPGVTPMIVDANGAIQAHPDSNRIAFNSGTGQASREHSLFGMLQGAKDAAAAHAALKAAAEAPGTAEIFHATLHRKAHLLAVSYIPELRWHVVTAVDLHAANVIDSRLLAWLAIGITALLGLAVTGFVYAVNRVALKPIRQLTQSAQAMAAGDYAVAMPALRNDEIGDLTAAFGSMADKVRRHTEDLEETVRERTMDLVRANAEMAAAHKKISDSITYASMIQRAILPDRQLKSSLGDRHFVLWQPRDVVGGDFYVYREAQNGCLLGVVDCAGHGVPGAFMTMLARAAIDQAIDEAGADDPAAILTRTDAAVRTMLQTDAGQHGVATNMDAGFAFVDFAARRVTFSGAKIALYWSDGSEVELIAGERRALGDRRPGTYRNETVPLDPSRSFYLTTDGFLDQAGGEKGYGFGNARFTDMIRTHARLPLPEQGAAFATALAAYQGGHPRRDDITILCFRFG